MLFLVGLQKMTKEEKMIPLAQLNTLTGLNLINDAARRRKESKNFLLGLGEKGAQWVGQRVGQPDLGRAVGEFKESTDWDAEVINKKFREEIAFLADLDEREISRMLRKRAVEIAEVDEQVTDQVLATAIINKAKRALGKNSRRVFSKTVFNWREIYAICISELIDEIKKGLMS